MRRTSGSFSRHKGFFALAAAAAAIAAFGFFGAARSSEPAAGADPCADAEFDQIFFSRNISDFHTIDDEDDAVLLERGVNDWRQTSLAGACDYNQSRFAQSVAIDGRPRGGGKSGG